MELKVLAYDIYARVIDVSEIERVRFLIQKQRVRKYRTKHFPCGIVFIIYILRHSSFGGLFILHLSKVLKFAATHLPQNDNENEVSAF